MDATARLTPFLPHSRKRVHELLGKMMSGSGQAGSVEVGTQVGRRAYAGGLQGVYRRRRVWGSRPIRAGTKLATPTPIFTKVGGFPSWPRILPAPGDGG